ncbi:MAG: esterase family protein [Bacteroidales bacterium]|jgi:enterochelin esterase-like enzyme|nr:esterase family protein [Bacteroidales bacterium]
MKRFYLLTVALLGMTAAVAAQGSAVYETRTVKSSILNMERRYAVYLPPGYADSDRSYPVLYLLHGSGDDHTGWVQFGQVQHIADKAIASGAASPMLIVMPDANTKVKGYFNQPDGSFAFEDFFFKELIPHIEKTYRVRTERRYRAISGLSMGGGGTIYYALHRPDMFAAACPLSATTGSDWIIRQGSKFTDEQKEAYRKRHNIDVIFADAPKEQIDAFKGIRWYVSCGDDDFLYKDNSLLHILFRDRGIPHEYRVKDGGHTWTYWRMELAVVLEFVSKSFSQF